jgi:hypothetical protein
MSTLKLTDAEARLLLDLVQAHANGLEFDIDAEAQRGAFGSWLLAGRIAELLDPPRDARRGVHGRAQ